MLKLLAAVALVLALGVATYALAGGNDSDAKRGKQGNAAKKQDAREGHGPPPWAPAYGWRCKEAGNQPGSAAFKDCIKTRKR